MYRHFKPLTLIYADEIQKKTLYEIATLLIK